MLRHPVSPPVTVVAFTVETLTLSLDNQRAGASSHYFHSRTRRRGQWFLRAARCKKGVELAVAEIANSFVNNHRGGRGQSLGRLRGHFVMRERQAEIAVVVFLVL